MPVQGIGSRAQKFAGARGLRRCVVQRPAIYVTDEHVAHSLRTRRWYVPSSCFLMPGLSGRCSGADDCTKPPVASRRVNIVCICALHSGIGNKPHGSRPKRPPRGVQAPVVRYRPSFRQFHRVGILVIDSSTQPAVGRLESRWRRMATGRAWAAFQRRRDGM
jgi:hypothetical protein